MSDHTLQLVEIAYYLTVSVAVIVVCAYFLGKIIRKRKEKDDFLLANVQYKIMPSIAEKYHEEMRELFNKEALKQNWSSSRYEEDLFGNPSESWIRCISEESKKRAHQIILRRAINLKPLEIFVAHDGKRRQALYSRGLLSDCQNEYFQSFCEWLANETHEVRKLADCYQENYGSNVKGGIHAECLNIIKEFKQMPAPGTIDFE